MCIHNTSGCLTVVVWTAPGSSCLERHTDQPPSALLQEGGVAVIFGSTNCMYLERYSTHPLPDTHTLTLECSKHMYTGICIHIHNNVRRAETSELLTYSSVKRSGQTASKIDTGRSQISYRYAHARTFQNPKLFVDVYEFECAPRSPSFLLCQAVVDVALISRRLAHLTEPDSDNLNHQTSGITSTYNSRHFRRTN